MTSRTSPSGAVAIVRAVHDFGVLAPFTGFQPVVVAPVRGVRPRDFVVTTFELEAPELLSIIISCSIATGQSEVTVHIANVFGVPVDLGPRALLFFLGGRAA